MLMNIIVFLIALLVVINLLNVRANYRVKITKYSEKCSELEKKLASTEALLEEANIRLKLQCELKIEEYRRAGKSTSVSYGGKSIDELRKDISEYEWLMHPMTCDAARDIALQNDDYKIQVSELRHEIYLRQKAGIA